MAVLVAVIWGFNFVVIDEGLGDIPPLLFAATRFALVIFPAALIIPRPAIPFRKLAPVGLLLSTGQFGFLYCALAAGMPSGLASLVAQAQVMFSVLLASLWLKERPSARQLLGIGVGVVGLVVVAAGRSAATPLLGVLLTVGAAFSWACGNIASRQAGNLVAKQSGNIVAEQAGADTLGRAGDSTGRQGGASAGLALTVWSAMFAPIPLILLSFAIDGPGADWHAVSHFTLGNGLSTLYTAVLASLVGYGVWNTLLATYPAADVVPFTLLVPPFGLLAAWLVQGEVPGLAEAAGGVLLLLGVAITSINLKRAAIRERMLT